MSGDHIDDLTDHEKALVAAYQTASELALRCRHLREIEGSTGQEGLDHVINTLMTELWDQGISQTEIRKAFVDALDDMSRYAAGCELRP